VQQEGDLIRKRRFAWAIAAMLFGGSVINYLDRAVLGVVMPQIRRDLVLTNTEYSWVVDAFLIAYMASYILGGRLADRLGYRRMVGLAVSVWSVFGMMHAAVSGLATLACARAGLGLGEAAFYPAAMRGMTAWFTPKDRAKAVGLLLSALSAGTLLAAPVIAWITGRYGWRASFLVTGAAGLFLLPPWMLVHRRIQALWGVDGFSLTGTRVEDEAGGTRLAAVLRARKYWLMLGARGCSDAAWYFYLFWIPGYFQEVRGLSLERVGRLLWIPYFLAGIGALAGAWCSSALIHRGFSLDRGRKTVMLPAAILASLGALSYFVPSDRVAIAVIGAALFGHQAWSSNVHTAISEISPAAHVAVLYGITGAAGTLMGALTQFAIGPMVDRSGYRWVFVGAGLLYLAAAISLLAAGRIEEIRDSRVLPEERSRLLI
jgi:ACS family hexuronate transporter-like MFS transporter